MTLHRGCFDATGSRRALPVPNQQGDLKTSSAATSGRRGGGLGRTACRLAPSQENGWTRQSRMFPGRPGQCL